MLWLYRLLFFPGALLLAPRFLLRMRRRGGYRDAFGQRFGGHPRLPAKSPGRKRIWIHAVSVGELLAIGPILHSLSEEGIEIYLTTTTSTGRRLAEERYAPLVTGIGYFPIDWWPFSARTWNRLAPDLAILTEGERWPEHLHQAARRRVPVLCINARVSDRSFARMRRVPALARLMIGATTRFLAGSQLDVDRLRELQVSDDRILMTGNLKLDVAIPALPPTDRAQLRRELGLPDGLVLLGSSTWPGEEEALVGALRRVRQAGLLCTLLLVPRHAERRQEIATLLRREELHFHLRSHGIATREVDIAVADTTGELRRLTQLADVVFIGKSLAPHTEGQTPVEAAALQKPILMGPGMSNFRAIANELISRGAARTVNDPTQLAAAATDLLSAPAKREALGQAASRWHRENAGAIKRTLAAIRQELTTEG